MRKFIRILSAAAMLLILILDSRAAIGAAREGIDLCIRTLIPSLFPFFVLSAYLTGVLSTHASSFLSPLERLCRLPGGSGMLLVMGLLGGYPVGARNVALACGRGGLSRDDASRMICFCNNAGPAFLFGMVGLFFENPAAVWLLWGIQIVSCFVTAALIPATPGNYRCPADTTAVSLTRSLEQAVSAMGNVCGWVIFFRIILSFGDRWILWLLPSDTQVLLKGLLELSNGCVQLQNIPLEGHRFLIASFLLSFGGICVTMQTGSVCRGISLRCYLPAKLLQGCISTLLATTVWVITFPEKPAEVSWMHVVLLFAVGTGAVLFLRFGKNTVAFPDSMMYNQENTGQRGSSYAFS